MMQMKLVINGSVQQISFLREIQQFIKNTNLQVVGECYHQANGELLVIAQGDLENLKKLHRFFKNLEGTGPIRHIKSDFSNISSTEYSCFLVKL